MITVVLLLISCAREEKPATCLGPRPTAQPISGDANSDGAVDISDGVALLSHLFRGGPAPTCTAAADVLLDNVIEAGDATGIWYNLFAGNTYLPTLDAGACTTPVNQAAACNDGLTMGIDAPATGVGPTTVQVTLTAPTLPTEAFSLGVAADGCSITDATLAQTVVADRRDTPPGQRNGGFALAELTSGGAVAAVVMDLNGDTTLSPSSAAQPILSLTVEASACGTCTLRLTDTLQGRGAPVGLVVTAGGRSYTPASTGASLELCPA